MKIEGRNAVTEALRAGRTIDRVIVAKGNIDGAAKVLFNSLKESKIKVQVCDREVLDRESETGKHQGFIAYATDYKYAEFDDIVDLALNAEKGGVIVLLDGIEDPHNLGSIVRSCECLGVVGMVIPKHRSVSVNDTVMKVSAGACEYVKIAKVTNINNAIEELKKKDFWIYGADMAGEDISKSDFSGNVALVIGAEGSGISQLTKKLCDKLVSIKMGGKMNSLNAGVAAGICLYSINTQRK